MVQAAVPAHIATWFCQGSRPTAWEGLGRWTNAMAVSDFQSATTTICGWSVGIVIQLYRPSRDGHRRTHGYGES